MKRFLITLGLALSLGLGAQAQTQCFADYKAKQDNPLRLHYGVSQISACNLASAKNELSAKLSAEGWTLLQVMQVFGPEGLDQRKESAGRYYLRY